MSDESILGYSLNQMRFISGGALSYQGVHRCFASKKGVHKKSQQNSSRSMYHLELVSEDGEFKGIKYVEGDEFDRARKVQIFGEYSIVTNGKGVITVN